MATYAEIFDIKSNAALRNKVAVACVVKAQGLIDEATPTNNEVAWANAAILNPVSMADKIMNYVLAANKSATKSQIESASDATIQTNVDAAIDKLIAGGIVS